MGIINDYISKGGAYGYAWTSLNEQFLIAKQDSQHPLRPVLDALQENNINLASSIFYEILKNAVGNNHSPLSYAATFFFTVPLFREAVKFVKENANNDEALQGIPLSALKAGLIEYAFTTKASASAKNKGKTVRDEVIAAWETELDKSNYSLFAGRLYKRLGGEYDRDGEKKNRKIPSESTIARIVSKYEKDKKSLSLASKRQDGDDLK